MKTLTRLSFFEYNLDMIYPEIPQDAKSTAEHYNLLGPWYLKFWGEHLHHGLWKTGLESTEKAVEQLIDHVAQKSQIQAGDEICDIGCGYGATARWLSEKWKAKVTGFTVSEKQQEHAMAKDPGSVYVFCDWLQNSFPPCSFDLALSIESSEHMVDKEKFFREIHRVLRPKGRVAICAWLAKETPQPWERKYLLEPICREGRLPSMGSVTDYLQWLRGAGFKQIQYEDLTANVKKTWMICAWRVLKGLKDPAFRSFLKEKTTERVFFKTVFRIFAAYQTKSMTYGLFTASRSDS